MTKKVLTAVAVIAGTAAIAAVAYDAYMHQVVWSECCWEWDEGHPPPSSELEIGKIYVKFCDRLGNCWFE